jgi:hypothetical protein
MPPGSSSSPHAGRHLPLGLGGQPRPRPGAVGLGVVPRDVHHRVVVTSGGVRLGAFGMGPVGPHDLAPPGRALHSPGGGELVGEQPAEDEGPAVPLGVGPPPGGPNEGGEVPVGDGVAVDPERGQLHVVDRALPVAGVRPSRVVAHAVPAGGHRDQRRGWRSSRPSRRRHRRDRGLRSGSGRRPRAVGGTAPFGHGRDSTVGPGGPPSGGPRNRVGRLPGKVTVPGSGHPLG